MTRAVSPALAALALTASLATAGPIRWAYSGHVRTDAGTGLLDLGTYRQFTDPSGRGTGETVYADYTYTAPLPELTFAGTSADFASGGLTSVFSVGGGYRSGLASEVPSSSDRSFRFDLTVTDLESGESGTVGYIGHASLSVTNEYPSPVLFALGLYPDEPAWAGYTRVPTLHLGGNRYTVVADGGLPDELDEPAGAWLQISAAVDTPEPGTLALAAAGLAAAATGWLRRRRHR